MKSYIRKPVLGSDLKKEAPLEIIRSLLLSLAIGFIAFSVYVEPAKAVSPYKECLIKQKQTNLDLVSIMEKCKVEL